MKFVAVSEYSVTQKPSSFQVREILKEEGKFKPPYFQSTVPISIFPPKPGRCEGKRVLRVTRRPRGTSRMLQSTDPIRIHRT